MDKLLTDYKGRCGNCSSELGPNDKYCRYCGTPVGEGAFQPYRNIVDCVYGPPVKELWSCPACGHKWRSFVLGGDTAKFCPICQSKKVEVLESVEKCFWGDYQATIDLDVVDLAHPEYFSPDEVEKVLSMRSDEPFDKEAAKQKLIAAGFQECEKACKYDDAETRDEFPDMTDREAERVNMELFMLEHVKGDYSPGFPHIQCPKCKGNLVSSVLKTEDSNPGPEKRTVKKGLYEKEGAGFRNNQGNYHCLLCDKYFDGDIRL